jgi:hypothetical protein
MSGLGKSLLLLIILILAASSIVLVKPSTAEDMSVLSPPEFNVKYIDYSNGASAIVVTIKNQPFTPYVNADGKTVNLYFTMRTKAHFDEDWINIFVSVDPYPEQTGTQDTVIECHSYGDDHFGVRSYGEGFKATYRSQIDIQVRANLGYYLDVYTPPKSNSILDWMASGWSTIIYFAFQGLWSDTQTLTVENPPQISVLSPQAVNYTVSDIPLNFTVDNPVSQLLYSLDGNESLAIAGNTTLTGLTNGNHNVTVYANDTYGGIGKSETVNFTVAVPELSPTEKESFPTTLATVSIVVVAVSGAGLLVYFKKRKGKHESI